MRTLLVAFALLALTARAAYPQGSAPADPAPLEMKNTGTPGKAKASRTRTATAVVTAIDVANRAVTLKNKAGETHTFSVGPQVERLDEVAVGDTVVVEYYEGLMLELQPAGAESVSPTAVTVGERAGKDDAPGGTAATGVRATVTVTAIDLASRTAVIQGPAGNQYQVKADPSIKLERLKVGDRLIATYVQAVAITLQKAPKK